MICVLYADQKSDDKGVAAAFKGLSKVTYATSSSDMEIDLDDDNFWEKVLPEMKTQVQPVRYLVDLLYAEAF